MPLPHVHTERCPPHCSRTEDVDERTATGAYRIVARRGYGNRPHIDKPRWWPFAFHAYKALIQLLGTLGILWVVNKLGWKVGP